MTGMWRGELLGLPWIDIDLDQRQLTAARQRIEITGQVIDAVPKTDAGLRTLDRDTAQALAGLRFAVDVDRVRKPRQGREAYRSIEVDEPSYLPPAFNRMVTSLALDVNIAATRPRLARRAPGPRAAGRRLHRRPCRMPSSLHLNQGEGRRRSPA